MKKASLTLLILTCILLITKTTRAQSYQTALGLKFGGYESGPSIKYFSGNDVSLEGILGIRSHGLVITGLYEINQTAFGVSDLKFYYGGGAHIGSVGRGTYKRFNGSDETYNSSKILLGADGVIGLEYVIPDSPIGISLDLNPRIELASGPFFDLAPGLGLKYVFK